ANTKAEGFFLRPFSTSLKYPLATRAALLSLYVDHPFCSRSKRIRSPMLVAKSSTAHDNDFVSTEIYISSHHLFLLVIERKTVDKRSPSRYTLTKENDSL